MNVFFQEVGTEDVLFNPREELLYIPNVGEDVYIEGTWYTVVERNLYLKHLDIIDDNTAQVSPRLQPWVELGAKKFAQLNHFLYICSVK